MVLNNRTTAKANELSWQGALRHRLGTAPPSTVLHSQYDPRTFEVQYVARVYLTKEGFTTPPFTDIHELLDYTAVIIRMHLASKEN
jgi:hypothetical protein